MTDIGHRQTSPSKLGIAMVIFILIIPFVAYQVRQMVKQRAAR